jgi:Xaa-Pro aminopeptidase
MAKNGVIYKGRISRVRKLLNQKQIAALLITRPANVTYTTGFLGDDSWVVISSGTVYLLTDSRYTEQARWQCRNCRIISRKEPIAEAAAKLLKKTKSKKVIAVESSTTLEQLVQLKKYYKGKVKNISGLVESLRRQKNETEIAAIKAAIKVASKALQSVRCRIRPGITEGELAGRLEFEIRRLGAQCSFETIVAFGANAAEPHHSSGKKRLRKNDTVLIDFGARLNGYCCDLTRCFTVGRTTRQYEKAYEAVEQAKRAAIKRIRAGVDVREVDKAARKVIHQHDFEPHGHGTGHGLGLEVHEQPIISNRASGKLEADDCVTIEPGIYVPGKFGIRLEEDVFVTKTGCCVLSKNCS